MSFMRSIHDAKISSAVPDSLPAKAIIDILHDHGRMINLNSLVKGFHPAADDDKEMQSARRAETDYVDCSWYRIEDDLPLFGRTSYLAAMKNHTDGLDSVVYAPAGLVMRGRWRVQSHSSGSGLVLIEENHMEGNVLLLNLFVKPTFEKAHRRMHQDILEQAQAADSKDSI